jgi:hypothetical protein
VSGATPCGAFHGDPARKAAMVDRVRVKWAQGHVFPLPYLKWRTDGGMVSLSGALAETQVPEEFVERTGLPVELATLCEGLVNSGAEFIEDKNAHRGLAMRGGESILAFAIEWLDAISVGADLGGVVPRFMHGFLASVLEPGFAMAAHLSPGVRGCAERILDLWKREIGGAPVAPQEWRNVRADALRAAEDHSDPWGFALSELVESLAWPARGLAPEFVPIFQVFMKEFRQFLVMPYLSSEDQDLVTQSLVAFRDLFRAQRDPELSQLPFESLLERQPQSKDAVLAIMKPETQARLGAAKEQAQPASDHALRQWMDSLLDLIRAGANERSMTVSHAVGTRHD